MTGRHASGAKGPALLREWRARYGVTQAALAEDMGFADPATISRYEARQRPLTYKRLVQVSETTGISIWDLAWPYQRPVIRAIAEDYPAGATASERAP